MKSAVAGTAVLLAFAAGFAPAAPGAPGALLSPPSPSSVSAPPAQLISAAQLREQLGAQRGKVIVLNLWATWCMPCLKEIPVLLQVTRQLEPRGVALIGVSMDEPQALQSQVEPFRLKFFPGFRTWLRAEPDMDSFASVLDPAWNEILPTTYIIGRDGKLRTKIQGARSEAQFRAVIEAALRARD